MTINIQALIEARDSLDEAISDLELPDDRAPQPVTIDEHGTYRFRANPIVEHLLETHPTEDMNTLAVRFHEDRTARSQFAQLTGYSISGAGDLSYANAKQIDGAQQAAELLVENNQFKSEHEEAVRGQYRASVEACQLRSQVAELKAAQTPRPMSEAPKDGTRILMLYVSAWHHDKDIVWGWMWEQPPHGWLPLPVDQGDKS